MGKSGVRGGQRLGQPDNSIWHRVQASHSDCRWGHHSLRNTLLWQMKVSNTQVIKRDVLGPLLSQLSTTLDVTKLHRGEWDPRPA